MCGAEIEGAKAWVVDGFMFQTLLPARNAQGIGRSDRKENAAGPTLLCEAGKLSARALTARQMNVYKMSVLKRVYY